MGPKSENIEKPLVFVCFFEGQSGHGSEGSATFPEGSATFPVGEEAGYVPRGGFRRGKEDYNKKKTKEMKKIVLQ